MSQGVVIELRPAPAPAQAPRLGPWERDGQSWVRRYLTEDTPGPIAVCACDNREGGWTAFPNDEGGASLTPVMVPKQPRKTALPALDVALKAALGWTL